ncbi:MAG: tetratricopeptide repeat protein [Candidatus Pacebacteria bacterium]|nr:tetratricopeptide repeat protein [Candidatus Paceibacterota bacterium]
MQRLAGEREQLALEKDEVFARKNELAKDIETLTDELEELIKEREETAHDLDLTQKNLDKLTARIDQARTAVEKWEQESKKLTQQMSDAREQYRTGDAETKETARETARLAQKELRELTPQLRDARDKLDDLLSTHTQKRLEELRNSRDGLAASLVEIEDKIAQKKQEKTLLEHEVTIQEARLKAIAAKLARNEKLAELIQLPEDQRTAEAKEGDWSQLAEEAVAGAKQVMERKTGKGVFLQRTAQEDIAQIEQAIKETKTVIAQVQEEREPLQKTFEELKTKASEQFEQFVKTYPKSKHVPENLARIGTIALEFENYQRASTYFDRLEKEYPDHSALKQAMFSLGKAQFEVGRTKEAVDAFNRLLADAEGQPTGNLNYIVLNMLEKGQPELALKAANELLERSKDPEHPDYVQLAGGTRENILYRASEAAFQAAKYDQAINNLEKLIEENPKTAHFFRAKILLARAKRAKTPPNLAGAREDLAEVRTLAEDEDIVTQSLIELARTYYAEDTAKGISRGLAQLGQIVLVSDGDVMVLIDEVREEDRSYLEDALYLSAQGHALLGHEDEQALVRKKYQELFPKGRYVEEMQNLPNAKFKSAAAPSAVPETK